MKLRSSTKLTIKYNIDEKINLKCLVTFIDLDSEIIEKKDEEIEYIYDAYQIELINNKNYIEENYDALFTEAKQYDYNKVANEVREMRTILLEKTDSYCLTDRNPSQAMIDYRQALRDITEQEGFPYNVTWPEKPENN